MPAVMITLKNLSYVCGWMIGNETQLLPFSINYDYRNDLKPVIIHMITELTEGFGG